MEEWVGAVLAPTRTAILVVDVQNDFVSPEGAFARNGMPIEAGRQILAPLAQLIAGGRAAGARPVYLRFVEEPAVVSQAYDRQRYRAGETLQYCLDEWGKAVVPELAPATHDPVVDKVRASGFFNTRLDTLLRCQGLTALAVTGMATESCVLATVIDATARDYAVVLVEDCLASFSAERHRAALSILAFKHPLVTSQQLLRLWGR
jgi:ureidoacrylate peracid hydrolase